MRKKIRWANRARKVKEDKGRGMPKCYNEYGAFNLIEVNVARRQNGMSDLSTVTRKCLSCDKEFDSFGRQNRMCPLCRTLKSDPFSP